MDYIMKDDTMYYDYGYPMLTWLISYSGDTILEMDYIGMLPADASIISHYRFNRVNY